MWDTFEAHYSHELSADEFEYCFYYALYLKKNANSLLENGNI